MKKNDIKQLHTMSKVELKTKLAELEKSLANTKVETLTGKIKNVHSVQGVRRDIARVQTVLGSKE
jgi:large subunit ribosomal protein L29